MDNSKLIEENKNLHGTVEVLQSRTDEMEGSLEEKTAYLLRLADEITAREEKIKTNTQLLSEADQKV